MGLGQIFVAVRTCLHVRGLSSRFSGGDEPSKKKSEEDETDKMRGGKLHFHLFFPFHSGSPIISYFQIYAYKVLLILYICYLKNQEF